MTRAERIAGGLWGLLVGDALGVPYEFHSPENLPPRSALEMTPPPGFRRAHATVPPGTWSDDGAQALCLLAGLLERGRFDAWDFATRLVDWRRRGYMAVDGRVFDVGIQTDRVIARLEAGVPPLEAALSDERSNGNGSLMRALPLALWHQGTDAELVRDAHEQSRVTHAHPRSEACVALYCLWARAELAGEQDAWHAAADRLRRLYQDQQGSALHLVELEEQVRPHAPWEVRGTGYVVDSLHSALAACRAGTFEDVAKEAIALGNDTDTTACIAAGIAGLRHGVTGIPARWFDGLRGTAMVTPLLEALLRHSLAP